MRHRSATFAVIALVVALGAARLTSAQDATPGSTAGHPLVGAWLLSDVGDTEEIASLVVFTSDGVYQQADYDGTVGVGSWEATGPTTAAMTFVQQYPGDDGAFGGSSTIRAVIEVAPDGQTFAAEYTLELAGEGMPAGEFGPGEVTAKRIEVEPLGTPVGTLEDLFAGFDEDAGTPEAAIPAATPAHHDEAEGGADASAPLDLWPAPADPLERAQLAGLEPAQREHLDYHVHAHLDIFVDGQPVVVPAGIGINVDDPGVRRFDDPGGTAYGGIELCDVACISPLHTHDTTGILHTESPTAEPNTLGQFFVEWGVELDASCVGEFCRPATPIAVYVDGEPYAGNPADIVLTDLKQIAIVIGTPPAEIPATADFSAA